MTHIMTHPHVVRRPLFVNFGIWILQLTAWCWVLIFLGYFVEFTSPLYAHGAATCFDVGVVAVIVTLRQGPKGRVFLASTSTLPGLVVRTESDGDGSKQKNPT